MAQGSRCSSTLRALLPTRHGLVALTTKASDRHQRSTARSSFPFPPQSPRHESLELLCCRGATQNLCRSHATDYTASQQEDECYPDIREGGTHKRDLAFKSWRLCVEHRSKRCPRFFRPSVALRFSYSPVLRLSIACKLCERARFHAHGPFHVFMDGILAHSVHCMLAPCATNVEHVLPFTTSDDTANVGKHPCEGKSEVEEIDPSPTWLSGQWICSRDFQPIPYLIIPSAGRSGPWLHQRLKRFRKGVQQ